MKYLQINESVKVSGGFITKPIAFITSIRTTINLAVPALEGAPSISNSSNTYVDAVYYKSLQDYQNGESSIYITGNMPKQLTDLTETPTESNIYELSASAFGATVKEA